MGLGEIELKGWKGYQTERPVPLWPVTFLVGPNGSGKSSLLEALALISHLARRGTLTEDLRPWLRGWPEGVFTRGDSAPHDGGASIRLRWMKSEYTLELRTPERPQISREELSVGGRKYVKTIAGGARRFLGEGAGRPLETTNPYESALGLIARSPERRKRAQRVIELMTQIEVYALDADFLRGSALDTRPIPYARKGTSLVSGLIDARRDEKIWRAVVSAIQSIQPDLESVETVARPRGVLLRFSDGRETQLDEESDGFVRAAGMFLVRYRQSCPAILGFDEPENGFHLSRLMDVIERLAPDPRGELPSPELLVLATHSPELVRRAVRALGKKTGVLALSRASAGQVLVQPWDGAELSTGQDTLDMLIAQGFGGR